MKNYKLNINERELDLVMMAISKLDVTDMRDEAKELYFKLLNQVKDAEFKEALLKENRKYGYPF